MVTIPLSGDMSIQFSRAGVIEKQINIKVFEGVDEKALTATSISEREFEAIFKLLV